MENQAKPIHLLNKHYTIQSLFDHNVALIIK